MELCKASARGNQEPRWAAEPEYAYTDGADAAQLVSAYGFSLDPWQQRVLDTWLGRDANDKFTATTCGLSVPRQNGKNALLEARELYGIVTMGETFLHTAHEVKTAKKAFARLCSFFENWKQYPELAAMVSHISRTNGQEGVYLWALDLKTLTPIKGKPGGSVEFSARSRGAARGFTVDTVVFDEAQELTDEQLEALMPTLSAAPSGNRQYIYTGTPPAPTSPGDVFARKRESAAAGAAKKTAWHEWSVEQLPRRDTPVEKLIELAYKTNPAMGYRIDEEPVLQEALTMSADGYARERLGWWAEQTQTSAAIPARVWQKSAVESIAEGYNRKRCLGVKFSPDGTRWTLAGCMSDGHGNYACEVIDEGSTEQGISELAEFIESRRGSFCAVAIDGVGAADALVEALSTCPRKYVIRMRTGDAIAAASMFLDALAAGKCVHSSQKTTDECAKRCPRRGVGKRGGWSFGSDGDADSAPLEALALALWACRNTRRNPKRKQRLQ